MECLAVARSLWIRGRFPSEALSFTEEDLDKMIQLIANSPSEPLSVEEERVLPRPESPIQAEQAALYVERPEGPIPRSREWCMEQMRLQIASKAKTPGYWERTEARRGRCGYCRQPGHSYFSCLERQQNQNK